MAIAELYQQAVQCMAVSLDIRRTWMVTAAGEIDRLTSVAKRLVSCATIDYSILCTGYRDCNFDRNAFFPDQTRRGCTSKRPPKTQGTAVP